MILDGSRRMMITITQRRKKFWTLSWALCLKNQIDVSSGLRRLTSPDGGRTPQIPRDRLRKDLSTTDSWRLWREVGSWMMKPIRTFQQLWDRCWRDTSGYRKIWTFVPDTDGLSIRSVIPQPWHTCWKKWILMPCWFSECKCWRISFTFSNSYL